MEWAKSPQGINVLLITIKTGAVILVTATAIFDQLPDSQIENTGNQTIEEIANKPQATSNKYSSRRIKVSGYLGKTYVYGEVIPQKNGKLEGYIYHPDNRKTYVYGEQINNRINLYDTNGNVYQMTNK